MIEIVAAVIAAYLLIGVGFAVVIMLQSPQARLEPRIVIGWAVPFAGYLLNRLRSLR